MKINAHKLGLAGGIFASIFYSLAIFFIKHSPYSALKTILKIYMLRPSGMMNMGLQFGTAVKITAKKYILGLSIHAITAYVLFYTFATIYNWLTKN